MLAGLKDQHCIEPLPEAHMLSSKHCRGARWGGGGIFVTLRLDPAHLGGLEIAEHHHQPILHLIHRDIVHQACTWYGHLQCCGPRSFMFSRSGSGQLGKKFYNFV
jgi:hypothetical protein